jgi:hypothetical protein
MTPFRLAKWYCDVLSEDGTLLIVTFGSVRFAGLERARLVVELHRPDGSILRDATSLEHLRQTDDGCVFDGGALAPNRLTWRAPVLAGSARLAPRFPATSPADPLLAVGRGALRWSVEIPDADAAVELGGPGGRFDLRGRGYCDRVLLDVVPWRPGLRRLTWGHAVFCDGAAWWLELATRRGIVAATWRDGVLVAGCAPPALSPVRTLVSRPVADLPVLRIPPLGAMARWLAGDPHEQRWLARAGGDRSGWAVHELVRWRAART